MPPDAPATPLAPAAAAPPPGGAPVIAPKPGETPAPPGPVKAKDHAALAREGFALRQRKAELDAKEQAWVTERAQLEIKAGAAATLEKELGVLKNEREAFLKDPIAWAAKNGGPDAEKAIRAFVEQSTPEKAIGEALARADKAAAELAELKAHLAKREKDEETRRETEAKQQREHQSNAAVTSFTRTVTADAKKYPYMNTMYEPEEIAAKAREFQGRALAEEWIDEQGQERTGRAYSFDEVASAFETFAKRAYDKRAERHKALFDATEGSGPESPSGIQVRAEPGNGRRVAPKGNGPQARTESRPASQPKKPRILTREEQAVADKALLREAFAKDEAAAKRTSAH